MRLEDSEQLWSKLTGGPVAHRDALVEYSPYGVLICDADGAHRVREGGVWARAELSQATTLGDLVSPAPRLASAVRKAVAGDRVRETINVGGRVWEIDGRPHEGGAIILVHEYEEPTESPDSAARAAARAELLAEGSAEGLWTWEIDGDRLWTSRRWLRLVGLAEESSEGGLDRWLERLHPEDETGFRAAFERLRSGIVGVVELETRIRHEDGRFLWVRLRAVAERDAEGRAVRLGGSLADLSEQKRAEERLTWQAWHDPLTGLSSRAFFLERLRLTIDRARRQPGHSWAVLFIDLDRFKVVNDSLGHLAGDALLRGMGRRIEGSLRTTDCVARFGGDEFAVLLDDLDHADEAPAVAERLLSELAEPFVLESTGVVTTASI